MCDDPYVYEPSDSICFSLLPLMVGFGHILVHVGFRTGRRPGIASDVGLKQQPRHSNWLVGVGFFRLF